jgi:hypothetical protein
MTNEKINKHTIIWLKSLGDNYVVFHGYDESVVLTTADGDKVIHSPITNGYIEIRGDIMEKHSLGNDLKDYIQYTNITVYTFDRD